LTTAQEQKKKLTAEITTWLNDELSSTQNDLIKNTFGLHNYKITDYFYNQDSLRLRSAGYHLLKNYFDCEEFTHDRNFYTGEILTLSQNLTAPFYINRNKITLFHHEHIVMCKMLGSVTLWLNNFH